MRTRGEIEKGLQETVGRYPSIDSTIRAEVTLELLLDIRELLRMIKAQLKIR